MADNMKKIFKEWDSNGDGIISQEEMMKVMKALGSKFSQAQFDQIFAAVDANKNGKVEYEEFINWLTGTGSEVHVVNNKAELFDFDAALRPLFKVYDKKNTGHIDLEEFQEAYGIVTGALKLDAETKGRKLEFACADSTFHKADVGKSGYLTFEEFVNWQKGNISGSGLNNTEVAQLFTHLAEIVQHVFDLSEAHGKHTAPSDHHLPVLLDHLENIAGTAAKLFHGSARVGKEASTGFEGVWPKVPEGELCVNALVHFHMNVVPVPAGKDVEMVDTKIMNILPEAKQDGPERRWIARLDRKVSYTNGKKTNVPYYYAWTPTAHWTELDSGSDFMNAFSALAPEYRLLGLLYTEAEFGPSLKWDCMISALEEGMNLGIVAEDQLHEFEDRMHELVHGMLVEQMDGEEPGDKAVEDNLRLVVELTVLQLMNFLCDLGVVPHNALWDDPH
eukprot:gnl/TRDRNA2_/TRDRNA2_180937_c0_seq1.p1 gnl/TRDRNA2_/TRDRNA2_180937_c0~~gnl/TRDRNA2_/TRDRNA2_180937_c0_seq1.p1  ORF type:complete len:447 (+),score=114.46 gnl/TRDRNA2_/TRDRNA2_180937_c0_seq1:92-1432(+)